MKSREEFESQEAFDRYVDYMMGNPADDWENATIRTPVHWCGKSEGHWDTEGVCSSHWTGEVIMWDVDNLDAIPEGKEEGLIAAEGQS